MNPLDQFPIVKEHRKQGTIVERMVDKGFDASDIELHLSFFDLHPIIIPNYKPISILQRLKNEQKAHIFLNFVRPK